jgi:hypothetical protein
MTFVVLAGELAIYESTVYIQVVGGIFTMFGNPY